MSGNANQDEHRRMKLRRAVRKHGNDLCCDCQAPNPTWASASLGVFLCMKCAGVHRSLGTHISKVKSLSLDKWDEASIKKMLSIGNTKSNASYMAHAPPHIAINEYSSSNDREAFIRDKYQFGKFKLPSTPPVDETANLFSGLALKDSRTASHSPKSPATRQQDPVPVKEVLFTRRLEASPWVQKATEPRGRPTEVVASWQPSRSLSPVARRSVSPIPQRTDSPDLFSEFNTLESVAVEHPSKDAFDFMGSPPKPTTQQDPFLDLMGEYDSKQVSEPESKSAFTFL